MPDLFDDFNRILKKDFLPILVKYLKDPNNKIQDNFNDLINDSQILFTDIFERISKNKNNYDNQNNYTNIENVTDINPAVDDEYDDLLKRLTLIEDNMINIEKILKDNN